MQVASSPGLLTAARTKIIADKFFRNVGVLTLASVIGAALSLGQGVFVARWLQPELFGLAALITYFPSLIFSIFDVRSGDALVKYLSEAYGRDDRERFLALWKFGYILDFAMALLALIVVLLMASWAARNIAGRPDLVNLIIVSAASMIPTAFVRMSQTTLNTLGRFTVIGWAEISTQLLRTVLVVVLVVLGFGLHGVIWGNAVAMIMSGIFYTVIAGALIYRRYGTAPLRGSWRSLRGQRRELFKFLAYNDLTVLLLVIPAQLDILVLGYLRGPVEVSYYKLAKSFASVTSYISTPLQQVAYPEIAKLWGIGNKLSFRNRVYDLAIKIGMPLGILSLLSIVIIPFALPVLVGSAFLNAVFATQLLMISSSVGLTFFWLKPVFFTQGRLRQWFLTSGVVILLFAAIYPFLALQFGYVGAAVSYLALNVMGIGAALLVLKYCN